MLKTSVPTYFKKRRDALMRNHPDSLFIFPANPHPYRNHDVHYPFRQETNFYYLSGFDEPESFLVLAPQPGAGTYQTLLFVRERNVEREIWDGERYGVDGALKVFGVDRTYPTGEFDAILPTLLKGVRKVHFRQGRSEAMDRRVQACLERAVVMQGRTGYALPTVVDPLEAVGELRLIKSVEEVELLRKAGQASSQAHIAVMKEIRPGVNESEMEALIDYQFRKHGCQRNGYGSIIAGGKNCTCLHYVANNEVLRDGDLFLIDAGGEHDYYTADITRTYPVGREFTDAQATIYDLVLRAQKAALAVIRPGVEYERIHQTATETLVEGLVSLGLLKGGVKEIIQKGDHKRFYPHGTGHYLGMDVHDAGLYYMNGKSRPLEAGMVLTVEPGLYFQPGDAGVPDKFRNIGIRIEDDILVTAQGYENLTVDTPKERADILKLRR
ncbi:MAG: aminopeptidase P N-terminal domain-containing protein [Bacteriovoracia bacterium]